jgi:hypothetical protein
MWDGAVGGSRPTRFGRFSPALYFERIGEEKPPQTTGDQAVRKKSGLAAVSALIKR